MTISSETNRDDYTGNGATDTYAYNFRILAEADLLVTTKDTDGAETTLALTTDYTVTGVGDTAGGNIVLVAGNLTTDYLLTIRRDRAIKQTVDIRNQGDFYPEIHEDLADDLVTQIQTLKEEVARAIKVAETDSTVTGMTLDPATALYIIRINAAGTGLELVSMADVGGVVAGNGITDTSGTWSVSDPLVLDPNQNYGTAATPTLAFGDGDTGFYESSANEMHFAAGGDDKMTYSSDFFYSSRSGGGQVFAILHSQEAASDNPIYTFLGDQDTGIGSAGADTLSLITGNAERLRLTTSALWFIGVTSILDNSGNELLTFVPIASATTFITIANNATGARPSIRTGGEANMGILFKNNAGDAMFAIGSFSNPVNYIEVSPNATTGRPFIRTGGEDGIGIIFTNSGSEGIFAIASITNPISYIEMAPAASGNTPFISTKGTSGVGLIFRDNDVKVMGRYETVADAVNYISISNSADGVRPSIAAKGQEDLGIIFRNNVNEPILSISSVADPANYINFLPATDGNHPSVRAAGEDTNVDLNLTAQGIGTIRPTNAVVEQVTALSDGATVATDASLGNVFTLTTTQNFTLNSPTNATNGQKVIWRIRQDGGGTNTITLGAAFRLGADITAITLSTAGDKTDYLYAMYNGTDSKWDVVGFVTGY